MKQVVASFAAGVVFSIGLVLGGMTQPSKVVGFLDFLGDWDPSLALVMGGAVAVHATLFRAVKKRKSPLLAEVFHVPTRRDLTLPLLLGAGLFGVGWGLGGFCPGPGITSLPTGGVEALAFVGSMAAGMVVFEGLRRARGAADARKLRAERSPDADPAAPTDARTTS